MRGDKPPELGMNRAEYDSWRWHLVCSTCGHRKSYFDLGGVRTRAAGSGKSRTILWRFALKSGGS